MEPNFEGQLYILQDQFQKLQEEAAIVEENQSKQINDLSENLIKLEILNETLKTDKNTLLEFLKEREDEIRYLQVELESALGDHRQKIEEDNCEAVNQTKLEINRIRKIVDGWIERAHEYAIQ